MGPAENAEDFNGKDNVFHKEYESKTVFNRSKDKDAHDTIFNEKVDNEDREQILDQRTLKKSITQKTNSQEKMTHECVKRKEGIVKKYEEEDRNPIKTEVGLSTDKNTVRV